MEVRGPNQGGPEETKQRFEEGKREAASDVRDRSERARKALENFSEQRSKSLRQVREVEVQRQLERADERKDAIAEKRASTPVQARGDAIELSPIARASDPGVDVKRQERLASLREDLDNGRLLSQERLERAARSLLSNADTPA